MNQLRIMDNFTNEKCIEKCLFLLQDDFTSIFEA